MSSLKDIGSSFVRFEYLPSDTAVITNPDTNAPEFCRAITATEECYLKVRLQGRRDNTTGDVHPGLDVVQFFNKNDTLSICCDKIYANGGVLDSDPEIWVWL